MSTAESGFILFDALLASGLLALAGSITLTIVVASHDRQRDELDRSVALSAMQSLAAQFAVLDDAGRARLDGGDHLHRYAFSMGRPVQHTPLAEWRITATSLRSEDLLSLSFLARR